MARFAYAGRLIPVVALLALAGAAQAQKNVTIKFDSPAKRTVWTADGLSGAAPSSGIQVEGTSIGYGLNSTDPKVKVFVWNEDSGNIAVRGSNLAAQGWNVTPADDRYVAQVKIRVEHKGQPVEAALIEAEDSERKQSTLIDSRAKGEATFWGVRAGEFDVKVQVSSGGKSADPVIQTFKLELKRNKPVPTFVVSIAEEVATVGGTAGSATDGKSGPGGQSASGATQQPGTQPGGATTRDRTNPFGQLIAFLVTVAVAAALFFFGFQWLKKNQSQVQSKLEGMGIEIPQKPGDLGAQAQVAAPIAPEPPQKIVLGDSDPDLVPPASVPVSAAITTGQPRLVQDGGAAYDLSEGATGIGREQGEIVIAGESSISRRHATVNRTGERVTIQDDGSTNGTYVNGAKISNEVELRPGDVVQLGAIRFRYEG